jgi:signal transduction histidine kinase
VVLIALIVAVAISSGAAKHLSLEELHARRAELARFVHAHPVGATLLYMGTFVVVVALSLPGALIMTLAGGLLFGLVLGTAAAVTGASTGALLVFLVVRSTLFADSKWGVALRRRMRPNGIVARMEAEVRRHAFSYLLSLRLMPAVPFALVNLVSGFVKMPLSTYLAATLLGIAPSTLIYVSVGAGLGSVFDQGGEANLHILLRPQVLAPLCALAVLAVTPHLVRLMVVRGRRQATPTAAPPEAARKPTSSRSWRPSWRWLSWPGGLSARLLLLTAIFVMLAELSILAPALAAFEVDWLKGRVHDAELASLAVKAAPAGVVSNRMEGELLAGAGVKSVAVSTDGVRRLLLQGPYLTRTPELVDLRQQNFADWLAAPFSTLARGEPLTLRVVDRLQFSEGDFIEILVDEAPLKSDLTAYMLRVLGVSALVSVIAGVLVYLTLNAFLVRPMQRITRAMELFRARPEDPKARLKLSGRRDEIGRAEAELDRMQEDLRQALQSRARLAALGEAVAKINHDLRNMLSSAQMVTERLAKSGDPSVSQALPRLERALDRAVRLADNVLAYGKTEEAPPNKTAVPLSAAALAAAEDAGLSADGVPLVYGLEDGLMADADPEQLHRILVNLFRNAREAIEARGHPGGRIRLAGERHERDVHLQIIDNGPGLPDRVRQRLFQAFASSGRPGGAGLGLAISRELARAQGGDLELVESGAEGTVFQLTLPVGGGA